MGHPITCVAAKATIDEIVERDLVSKAAIMWEHMKERLNEFAEVHPQIGDVRGKGLLIGVELVKDRENMEPATQMAAKVAGESLKRGLMIGAIGTYRQTLRFTSLLILTEDEADRAVEIIDESLKETGKKA